MTAASDPDTQKNGFAAFAERRGRVASVLLLLAAGGLVLLGSTQTWLTASLESGVDLPVSGSEALPVMQPLALASLAMGLGLTLLGRWLRYVVGALAVAAGAGLVIMIAPVAFEHPVSAVETTVTDHSGLMGIDAVSELVTSIQATAWPLASLVAAAFILVAGALVLVTASHWRRGGRRYETRQAHQTSGPVDPVDSWDDLSHGEDPTR